MATSTILSDNGASSGTSGIKTSGGNDGTLVLQTTTAGGAATTAVTIDTGQRTTFPTTIAVGAATPSTSGSGITFPATQSASSDANTLDDYEEGTWTASDQSGAGLTLTQTGTATYTKIGRMVYFTFYVTYPSTANASAAKIALPFTNGGIYQTVNCLYTNSANAILGEININAATMSIYDNDFNGTLTSTTNAQMSGKYLIVSGCYSI